MNTLYLTIGNIGSGKTTWARRQAEKDPKIKIVSPDSIRQMLNGTYKYIPGMDTIITDLCCHAIRNLLLGGYDVIVDCCNMTVSRRMPWVQIARSLDYGVVYVIMPRKDKAWHVANRMKEPHAEGTDWGRIYDGNEKVFQSWDAIEGPLETQTVGATDD